MNFQVLPFSQPTDPRDAVQLSNQFYRQEMENVIAIDLHKFEYEIANTLVNNLYFPNSSLLLKIVSDHTLIGWCWVSRHFYEVYSSTEQGQFKILHLDLSLPIRKRIAIISKLLDLATHWCEENKLATLISSTNRDSQSGFIKLHQLHGFICKGSYCYKRIMPIENDT